MVKPQRSPLKISGVSAAARDAVAESRRVAAPRAHAVSGVGQARPGLGSPQNACWNASMAQFQKNTDNNIPGVSETRCRPGAPFIPPPGVHLERNAAAIPKPLVRSPFAKVAFLSDTPQEQRGSHTTITGRHRCAEADLVIVPDLSILHDAEALAGSPDLAVCLLYIVSLGLTITTQKHWDAARGVPRNLQPLACVRHVPLCKQGIYNDSRVWGARLKIEQPDVHSAAPHHAVSQLKVHSGRRRRSPWYVFVSMI